MNDYKYIFYNTHIEISEYKGSGGDVTIPSEIEGLPVTKICFDAFQYYSVTKIGKYAFNGCENLIIYGKSGSYAETYAKEYNIPFKAQ